MVILDYICIMYVSILCSTCTEKGIVCTKVRWWTCDNPGGYVDILRVWHMESRFLHSLVMIKRLIHPYACLSLSLSIPMPVYPCPYKSPCLSSPVLVHPDACLACANKTNLVLLLKKLFGKQSCLHQFSILKGFISVIWIQRCSFYSK